MSMVIDKMDMENTTNWFNPSPAISVDISQHAKKRHSYFNNLENVLFSTNKYRIKIIIATMIRETLKNVFIALNPKMSKTCRFQER